MNLHRGILTGFLASLSLCIAIPAAGLTPVHLWSQHHGGTQSDYGECVAITPWGDVVVVGTFNGTANFGGTDLIAQGSDVFIAVYDESGAHLWSRRYGSTTTELATWADTDAAGNIYVLGHFTGTANLGTGDLVSAGNYDVFVAKYDAIGTPQWSRRGGGTSPDFGYGIVVNDIISDVFITGTFQGTVDFGGGNIASAGVNDIFLAMFNGSGAHQWSRGIGGSQGDMGLGVALNSSGNILLTGTFSTTVNFGGGNLVSAGSTDAFLAWYTDSGSHIWSERFGGPGIDRGYAVVADEDDRMIITGSFNDTANFGGADLVSAGSSDIFVASFDAVGVDGVHRWSGRFGGTGADYGQAICRDGRNNVTITGKFENTIDFGGGPLVSDGSSDICIAKFTSEGVHRWALRGGDTSADQGNAVAWDPRIGNLVVTGDFQTWCYFGGSLLHGFGSTDVFVVKFDPAAMEPEITSIADIGNDQGRKVKIRFQRSGYDKPTSVALVLSYEVYRRDDAAPAAPATGLAARRADGWTQVGTVAAHQEESYGVDAPTIGDSTIALGQYHSVFYVRAATADPGVFWDSPVDSGYSLDNLAPGVPQGLTFDAGDLAWMESTAEDFDYFTIYGSNTDNFAAATVVDFSTANSFTVSGKWYVYYFVTATDFSGNEGQPATVNTLSAAGGTPSYYVLSVTNYPNPFNPGTTIRYTVPSRGPVTIAVYDSRGGRVATIVRAEDHVAGAYSRPWDGRSDGGIEVSSGVYFARIDHPAGTRSRKLLLLK